MVDFTHDLHLRLNFPIKHSIFDESPFLELFSCKWSAIELVGKFIHHCKSTFTNYANFIICQTTIPLLIRPTCGNNCSIFLSGDIRGKQVDLVIQ